ncbi:MAG: acyl-CoA dehydrogenase C-terminal domain-containing protein, partial [Deltaproteobacteria bacterium]|nr:acyl-CoA dehydrogenase C-terminal domain-containing protein [Deltaproteobacteria bacterium]
GAPFIAFNTEVERFCEKNIHHLSVGNNVRALLDVVKQLSETALKLKDRMTSDPLQWAACTYPALLCFSEVFMSWRLLDLAIIAHSIIDDGNKDDFFTGKIMQATYFTDITLPQTSARIGTLLRSGREISEIPVGAF